MLLAAWLFLARPALLKDTTRANKRARKIENSTEKDTDISGLLEDIL